ncbi:MAG: DNA invertase Pin-like site-specific DNA recombinase [Myxococcota bacterium]|jgi:DNA invertase Pin-like site-specific DNA recombinase
MTVYGYARVSTTDQDPTLQVASLEGRGCTKVVIDRASGGTRNRPGLEQLLSELGEEDVFVVWKLDRLSRSLVDLLWILDRISEAGAGFRTVTEAIDTTTAAGRMMMQMLGAFAEFEREMIRERTLAGLEAAKKRGQILGRRPKLTPEQQTMVSELLTAGRGQREVARLFGVGQKTISRIWQRHKATQVCDSQEAASDSPAAGLPNEGHKRTSVNHPGRCR